MQLGCNTKYGTDWDKLEAIVKEEVFFLVFIFCDKNAIWVKQYAHFVVRNRPVI